MKTFKVFTKLTERRTGNENKKCKKYTYNDVLIVSIAGIHTARCYIHF